MPYVIKRTDQGGGYVAERPQPSSYTKSLERAKKFASREVAEKELCPENEVVLSLREVLGL